MGPFSLNRRCLRLQISGILLWSDVTLQCGDILISRSWGVSAFPQKNSCHQMFYMNDSCCIREILNKHHVKGTIHPKMERRYLKDFSMDFGQTIKYWFETTCFEQTIPLTVRYFHIHSFHYVAENQQISRPSKIKVWRCVLKYLSFMYN